MINARKRRQAVAYNRLVPTQIYYRWQGFEEVFNATFRRWRDATGRGGDFLVYSDVEWVAPTVREIAL